jgi:[ribosomal protein S18]-alanine N-acetyltransferase
MRLLADTSDAGFLASLHAQCFDEAWSTESIAGLLATPGTFAFAAEEGFVLMRVAAEEAEVLTVGVRPAARRRGVAASLIRSAVEHASEMGANLVFLEVDCTNLPAIALYKRLGFTEVGRRRAYYAGADGKFRDALVLRSEIPLPRVSNCLQLG